MKPAVDVSTGSKAETASHRGEQRTHSDTRGPAALTCFVGVGRWVGG